MHPAPSLIVFTSLSGFGFGLMMWLGTGATGATGWHAFAYAAVAMGCAVIGLLASTLHLGNPQRAWRALSQWRSSWLSREGVLSIAALLVFGCYAFMWVFLDSRLTVLGIGASVLAVLVVLSTAMIYAQLRTVPRWHRPETPGLFLLLALTGGAMAAGQPWPALVLALLAGILQVAAWQRGDSAYADAGSTIESATGLTDHGRVRLFEAPHTSPNYLMREMVFVVGRRRSAALRRIGLLLASGLPAAFCLVAALTDLDLPFLLAGIVSHLVGVTALRWLFFAEAEHVVGLYYGRRPETGQAA